jgi:DNA ligase-1
MTFKDLASYFEKIEKTTSRLAITELLAQLFKKLTAKELEMTVFLLQGRVAPLYEKVEFGMAEKMVIKAAVLALNLDTKFFMKEYKKIGDLGETVYYFKKQFPSFEEKELKIEDVFSSLEKMAKEAGEGAYERKINLLSSLIRQLDPLSCCYLVRIPTGVLRLGFSDMTILDALSWMEKGDKSLRKVIETAYHVRPNLGYIAKVIKEKGVSFCKKITPSVFTPILMMKAERLSSAKEILEKIGPCAVESKYDGFRLQIHYSKEKDDVKIFSRNLEEVSSMYPDIVLGVKNEIEVKNIIFEGEAIGFNPQTGDFLPFQETVQRKRKYGVEEKSKEIPLKLFAYELLYLDDSSFIHHPFEERRKALEKVVTQKKDIFKNTILLASQQIVSSEKKLELIFYDAVSRGLEGIVAKKLDGIYQAGARGWNWIKFKRSYSSKIEDTIDCLVMGYDVGKGKRTSFGIGAFLVGVFDEDNDLYVTVAKIGTGLSDEEWRLLFQKCQKIKVKDKPKNYLVDKTMACDVWVLPSLVVEIRADEITRSPVHTAGRKMKKTKTGQAEEVDVPGFALRFPRLERFREDKSFSEVTTLKELESLYHSQKR